MDTLFVYTIYLCIAGLITIQVGKDLHRNGYHLILDLFDNETFSKTVNNLLLTGYYLVNIGYIAITVSKFGGMDSEVQAIEELSRNVGTILLILGTLHFNNIIVLHALSKRKQSIINYINT